MMARYLVTGGLGFIGSCLAQRLAQEPESLVEIVDCRLAPTFSREEQQAFIAGRSSGRLVVHETRLEAFQASGPWDVVFHLASVVGPAGVLVHAGQITSQVVETTYAAIRIAQDCGTRLVNVSTSEVYGGGVDGLCEEATARIIRGDPSARQEYAVAKLACEVAIGNLCQAGKLDAVTIRPFNVVGPRQSGGGGFVLPRFIGQALTGRPLTVFGDGSQVRALTDVADVADGLVLASRTCVSGTVLNLGNDANRCTIRGLAEMVLEVVGVPGSLSFVDPRNVFGPAFREAESKFPDATRIKSLGWLPKYDLRDTIRRTIEYMRALPVPDLERIAGL